MLKCGSSLLYNLAWDGFEWSWLDYKNVLALTFWVEERVDCPFGRLFMSECLKRHADRTLQGGLPRQGSVVSFTLIYINTNQ